jgi:diguanylate cyclase (GGDEF)-like protein
LIGAELTRLCRRETDLAARCGGEEFAIVLSETSAPDARRFADTVCQTIADLKVPHPSSPVAPFVTVSVGVATATRAGCSTRDCLVAAADRALYAAKKSGRNRVCIAQQESAPEEQLERQPLISV